MSDDIEELVSNLTLAVKNTLEPYVKKLNMDKERNTIITNLLKSLPEYKEMEHELKTLKEKRVHAAADDEVVPVLHRKITDAESQTQPNTKDASTQTCDDTQPITNDASTQTQHITNDTQTNTAQPITTPNTQPGVIGGVNPLKLNVIEKEVSVVEDVDNKVKEIYTEANVSIVNNILRNSVFDDTIKVLKLPAYEDVSLYKVSPPHEEDEDEELSEYEDEDDLSEDHPTDSEEQEDAVVEEQAKQQEQVQEQEQEEDVVVVEEQEKQE
jgi:hypothetical protein